MERRERGDKAEPAFSIPRGSSRVPPWRSGGQSVEEEEAQGETRQFSAVSPRSSAKADLDRMVLQKWSRASRPNSRLSSHRAVGALVGHRQKFDKRPRRTALSAHRVEPQSLYEPREHVHF